MTRKIEALVLGIMCFLLSIAICIQIRTISNNGGTVSQNARETELRDQVLRMKERYDNLYSRLQEETKELETTRTRVSSNNQELKSLEEKIKEINILLGLTDVTRSWSFNYSF